VEQVMMRQTPATLLGLDAVVEVVAQASSVVDVVDVRDASRHSLPLVGLLDIEMVGGERARRCRPAPPVGVRSEGGDPLRSTRPRDDH